LKVGLWVRVHLVKSDWELTSLQVKK